MVSEPVRPLCLLLVTCLTSIPDGTAANEASSDGQIVIAQASNAAAEVQGSWSGALASRVPEEIAEAYRLSSTRGALVRELHRSSPLRSAGIVKGDVLIALDAVQLTGPQDLDLFLKEISPAGTFILTYSRAGQVNTVRVRAEAAPEIPPRRQTLISGRNPFSGAIMANLSPAVGTELELGALERGVVIIDPGARTANTNGFRKRDIVSEINERKTETVSDLVSALAAGNRKWRMRVKRSGRVIRLALVQTKSPTVRTERTALHARKSTTQGITSRSAVLKLQRDLSALGYDPGPKDGVLGNRVRSAISAFRRDRGIRQSGELSPWLLRKIHEAAKRKNEAANTSMVPPVEEEGPLKLEGLDELD